MSDTMPVAVPAALLRGITAPVCVRMAGDALLGRLIFPGDILICDPAAVPTTGDLIAAEIWAHDEGGVLAPMVGTGEYTAQEPDWFVLCPAVPGGERRGHGGTRDSLRLVGVVRAVLECGERTNNPALAALWARHDWAGYPVRRAAIRYSGHVVMHQEGSQCGDDPQGGADARL